MSGRLSKEEQQLRWRISSAKYKQTNPNALAVRQRAEIKRQTSEKRKAYQITYLSSFKGRAYILRRGAKQRAIKFNLPFDLTVEWVEERLKEQVCEKTGLPLELITKETYGKQNNIQPFSPCIDRKIPSLGYTQENCQIVCNIYNQCKMHWLEEHVETFVKAYYERNCCVGKM